MSENKKKSFDLKALPSELGKAAAKLGRYAPVGFFLLLAAVYGFVLLRITTLSNVQPDSSQVTSQVSQLTPHIDKSAVKQLQSLEDNSVNVQTLFNQARSNPFGD
jgi:hypothetical protein